MNFQRQDLAGAIRTESFLKPVPVSMGPSPRRILTLILIVEALIIIWLLTGCTAPLISSDIRINDSLNNNEIPLIK